MSKYINADELIMFIRKECLYNGSTLRIIDKISTMPSFEQKQVICKHCVRWKADTENPLASVSGLHKCRFLDMYTDESFYCALGEYDMKEGKQNE